MRTVVMRFRTVLVAGMVLGLAACAAEVIPTAPVPPSPSLLGAILNGTLLRCNALPYSSSTAVIGPAGGTLQVGPHRLVVPAGALPGNVSITGEVISGAVNSVRLSPDGLQFGTQAVLTMSYANCPLAGLLPLKKVAYTDEGLSILSVLRSIDNLGNREVTARLNHFSRYAVSY
jgi:hypothetical protein